MDDATATVKFTLQPSRQPALRVEMRRAHGRWVAHLAGDAPAIGIATTAGDALAAALAPLGRSAVVALMADLALLEPSCRIATLEKGLKPAV